MDVVYVNRDGENPELRYSLRSLRQNVDHNEVWVFGGAPTWLDLNEVNYRHRNQGSNVYLAAREHLRAACNSPEVSDPFMLWNDDFFAMRPVGEVPVYHRGPFQDLLVEFAPSKIPWAKGMRETAEVMEKQGLLQCAMSYDTHLPLIIHKAEMLEAFRTARQVRANAIHLRTLYGAVANLGGEFHPDPKMLRRSVPFPPGAWLSSSPETFRSSVEPVLRYLFPDKCPYERE
jgi:hypothetical protein